VVPGLGVRCVDDQPWVTGAESCELVLALHAAGQSAAATRLFADVQHLRDSDGAYWTGWQFAHRQHFPGERSAWTAAAVILAADALSGTTGGANVFRDVEAGPGALAGSSADCDCASGSAGGRQDAFEHP
jgi:hypothetical protein